MNTTDSHFLVVGILMIVLTLYGIGWELQKLHQALLGHTKLVRTFLNPGMDPEDSIGE